MDDDLTSFASTISAGARYWGLRDTGWTAHSPRVGYATGRYLTEGETALPGIQHDCRWQNKKSLKTYLDVVGAAASRHSQDVGRFASLADESAVVGPGEVLAALRELAL